MVEGIAGAPAGQGRPLGRGRTLYRRSDRVQRPALIPSVPSQSPAATRGGEGWTNDRERQSIHQAVPDGRRANAAAACGEPGDGGANPLPPSARIHRDLRPGTGAPAPGLRDREPGAQLRRLGQRGDGVGGREPGRPGRAGRGRRLRQVRRALVRALPGLRWRDRVPGGRVGRGDRPRRPGPGDRRDEAAPAGGVHDPLGELDRGGQRRSRPCRRRPRPRRGDLRRRDLGPRRGRAPPGRVGGGRGRRRLAEGPDVPARARLRLGERAGDVARRRAHRPALLLRLGADRLRAGGGAAEQPLHPGGDALARPRRRPRVDQRGGP